MGWMASSFWRRRMSGCSRLGTDARRAAWRLALNVLVNGLPANKPAFRPAGQVGNLPHLKINAQSELDQPRVHGRAADLSERGRIQIQTVLVSLASAKLAWFSRLKNSVRNCMRQ